MSKTQWLFAAPLSATNTKADTPLFPYLNRLIRGEDLETAEAADFFRALTALDANPAQIAACLTALTAKGETAMELAGMARTMRAQAVRTKSRQKNFIDVSGTGSSIAKTFNVSTAAALVAAGAGLPVAKHGNRAVMSKTGSADVLARLGVKITCEPELAQTSLNGAGICFMFAPKFHPTLRRVGDIRRALGIRTSLNLLGVLSNPANAPRQLLGVWHPSLLEPMGQALSILGTERAWIVHGSDGLDEITLADETFVVEVVKNEVREFRIAPEDFKLPRAAIEHLRTKTPEESASVIRDVLSSKRRDEARALVVINAAAALLVGGITDDPVHAARLAEQSIDSGQAQNKLTRLVQTTNKR